MIKLSVIEAQKTAILKLITTYTSLKSGLGADACISRFLWHFSSALLEKIILSRFQSQTLMCTRRCLKKQPSHACRMLLTARGEEIGTFTSYPRTKKAPGMLEWGCMEGFSNVWTNTDSKDFWSNEQKEEKKKKVSFGLKEQWGLENGVSRKELAQVCTPLVMCPLNISEE